MMHARILQKNNILYKLLGIATMGALLVLLLRSPYNISVPQSAHIVSGNITIPVTIADTDALREKGLSDTESLAPHSGKLFIFDHTDTYGFWMKDMRYPLDIIWIDTTMRVVAISNNIAPETYPTVFYPPTPVQYVLEINANEAAVDNLAIGRQLTFQR